MWRFTGFHLLVLMFFSTTAFTQFSIGTRMAGANVGSAFFSSGNSNQTETTLGSTFAIVSGYGISISPSLGFFLTENTAVGFSFILNPSGDKVSFEENGSTFQKDKSRNFNAGIGFFARNYFNSSGTLLPFVQLSADAGIANRKTEGFFYGGSGTNVYKETYDGKGSGGFFANLGMIAGVTKMVGKYTGLDLHIGYNLYYTKNTMNTTTLRDIGIDGNIDETRTNETITKFTNHRFIIGLGFQVFLERKKK